MANKEFYKQCFLQRKDIGNLDTAWIPECFAIKGKIIKIKIDDQWQDWEVKEVYSRASFDELLPQERDHLNQRKVSDV